MKKFLVEMSHTREECLRALDSVLEKGGPDYLDKFEWGCADGNHTGWAVIEGKSKSAVRDTIPKSVQDESHVTEVDKFTPEQLRKFHEEIGN